MGGGEPIDAALATAEATGSPSVADFLIMEGMGTAGLS
jgi:hypothetical protein